MLSLLFAAFVSVSSLQASVAQLQTKADDAQATLKGHCSAVVLEGDLLLTEEHCVVEEPMFADGIPVKVGLKQSGLVILEPTGRKREWRGIRVSEAMPRRGEIVYAAGFAYAEFFAVTQGRVSGYSDFEGVHWLWADLEVIAGMSGGAIVDSKGRLVTLVRLSRSDGLGSPNGFSGSADPRDVREIVAAARRGKR